VAGTPLVGATHCTCNVFFSWIQCLILFWGFTRCMGRQLGLEERS